jgi:hypothetical protein
MHRSQEPAQGPAVCEGPQGVVLAQTVLAVVRIHLKRLWVRLSVVYGGFVLGQVRQHRLR